MTDSIKPDRTPEFSDTRGDAISIGEVLLEAPTCTVLVTDIPGATTMLIQRENPGDSRVAIMLYAAPVAGEEHGRGHACQMTAEIARSIGASLIRLAAIIQPTAVH